MKTTRVLLCVLLVLTIATGAYAMIATFKLDKLVSDSEVIVIATLKTAKTLAPGTENFSKIENTIIVEEVLKGSVKVGDALVVETIADFEDSAVFQVSTQAVVFLKKTGSNYETTNMIQGYWAIEGGKFTQMGSYTTKAQLVAEINKK